MAFHGELLLANILICVKVCSKLQKKGSGTYGTL